MLTLTSQINMRN